MSEHPLKGFFETLRHGDRLRVRLRNRDEERELIFVDRDESYMGLSRVVFYLVGTDESPSLLINDHEVLEAKKIEHPGITALREALLSMRLDDQDGYTAYQGDGVWSFVSTSLAQVTPSQLNAMFDLAGVVPDKIVSKGSCGTCLHANPFRSGSRGERGRYQPCVGCKRPRMSRFEPMTDEPCIATKEFGSSSTNPEQIQCVCPLGHAPESEHGAFWGNVWCTWREDAPPSPCHLTVGDRVVIKTGPMAGHVERIQRIPYLVDNVWWVPFRYAEDVRATWTRGEEVL